MGRVKYPVELQKLKGTKKISMLTAYDYSMASILNNTDIDAVLVGDSLSGVILGNKDTLSVNFIDILSHTKAVAKGFDGIVVSDIPFMGHLLEKEFYNSVKDLMQAGASGIKIEGVSDLILKRIELLVESGVPVMGHLGLTPQSYLSLGGYKYQGKTDEARQNIIDGAKKLEASGVFGIVLECIPDDLGEELTEILNIPTIGIGSGKNTDGQILVVNDMLNLTDSRVPSFVTKFADLNKEIKGAVKSYIDYISE